MTKALLLTIALLAAAPVSAQSIYPNIAGSRYCNLRGMGVSHDEAMTVAIRDGYSHDRQPVMMTVNGRRESLDIIEFARWVVRCQ